MLSIKKEVFNQMIAHAQEGFPLEVCGYLGEREGIVSLCRPMENTDKSNEHFSMNPAEQFAVVKEFRASGHKASVVYHSHPETPSRPSEEDIRLAFDPNVHYVIVSLAEETPVAKSFIIKDNTVEHEEIVLV